MTIDLLILVGYVVFLWVVGYLLLAKPFFRTVAEWVLPWDANYGPLRSIAKATYPPWVNPDPGMAGLGGAASAGMIGHLMQQVTDETRRKRILAQMGSSGAMAQANIHICPKCSAHMEFINTSMDYMCPRCGNMISAIEAKMRVGGRAAIAPGCKPGPLSGCGGSSPSLPIDRR